jgi:hypothetical protein
LFRKSRIAVAGCSVVAATAFASAGASAAQLGKAPAGGTTATGIKLVNLTAPGTAPRFGQQVTFTLSTAGTAFPWVELRCYLGPVLVYDNWVGYFASYQFPQVFTLGPTQLWTGGAANCSATVVDKNAKRPRTLATLNFAVSA